VYGCRPDFGAALVDVPEALKAVELCIAAAKDDAEALLFVPEALIGVVHNALADGGRKHD